MVMDWASENMSQQLVYSWSPCLQYSIRAYGAAMRLAYVFVANF